MWPSSRISRATISTTTARWRIIFAPSEVLVRRLRDRSRRAPPFLTSTMSMAASCMKLCKKKSAVVLSYGLTAGDFHAEAVEITRARNAFSDGDASGQVRDLDSADRQCECVQRARGSAAGFARGCSAEAIAQGIFNLASVPGPFRARGLRPAFHGGRGLRAHRRCAPQPHHAGARFCRPRRTEGESHHAFRVRRRPRSRQASADGRGRGQGQRFRRADFRQPALRGSAGHHERCAGRAAEVRREIFDGARPPQGHRFRAADRRPPATSCCWPARGTKRCRSRGKGQFPSTMWRWRARTFGSSATIARTPQKRRRGRPHETAALPHRGIHSFGRRGCVRWPAPWLRDIPSIREPCSPGELFFAVKGERLDGHDFVEQALSRGAIAAVVRKDQVARYSESQRSAGGRRHSGRAADAGHGSPKDVGQDCHRHHRFDGQDDDEGSDGPFARDQDIACIARREISTIILACRSDC